jgi:acyl carrier protein
VTTTNHPTVEDHPDLREALKRCSPATYYAACKFRQTGASDHLRVVIAGLVERFVDRELRAKIQSPHESLRLREDLGLDSLTMMEIVMLAEDILPISTTNEELARLRTLADVETFFEQKIGDLPATRSDHATEPASSKIGAAAPAPLNPFAS